MQGWSLNGLVPAKIGGYDNQLVKKTPNKVTVGTGV